jgi:hypothetical protein
LQRLEERIQGLEREYHLHLTEFQRAVANQWEVTNGVAASARELLKTAEQLLQAAEDKLR